MDLSSEPQYCRLTVVDSLETARLQIQDGGSDLMTGSRLIG